MSGPGESPEWLDAAEKQAITEALDPPPFCDECWDFTHVAEVFDETLGHEEQQREVVVTRLACGHEIVNERGSGRA